VQPIILGIDPGTTLGYAILDLDGSVLKVSSSRTLNMSDLIEICIRFGKPILAGCDKKSAPSFVEKFCARTGARLISPKLDLTKYEKDQLVSIKTRNDHEFDALASATYAYNKFKRLFKDVNSFLGKMHQEKLADELMMLVIKHEKVSIKTLYERLMKKPIIAKVKIPKKKTDLKIDKIKKLEKKLAQLFEHNEILKKQLASSNELMNRFKRKADRVPVLELVEEKTRRIKNLTNLVAEKDKLIKLLNKEYAGLQKFVGKASSLRIVKKLANLGKAEFEMKSFLNIKEGDILLVEDPNICNTGIIKDLKRKIRIIITKKTIKGHSDFIFIRANSLKLIEHKDFALVDMNQVEEMVDGKNILKKVLQDYKKKRA